MICLMSKSRRAEDQVESVEHLLGCSSPELLWNTTGMIHIFKNPSLVWSDICRWTWRPCYLVIALMSLAPWAIITWLVPVDPPNEKDTRLDWIGSVLMGVSLFLLLFGFSSSQTERNGWRTLCELPKSDQVISADDSDVPIMIGGSVLFMICFVLRQMQLTKALDTGTKAKPLIPRSLLSLQCWDLLVIYVAAVFTWASTDVS
jgi:hypothetical protein